LGGGIHRQVPEPHLDDLTHQIGRLESLRDNKCGSRLRPIVSGQPPYSGDTAMTVMLKHVTTPVPDLRSVWPGCPEELARVVMKMMQK